MTPALSGLALVVVGTVIARWVGFDMSVYVGSALIAGGIMLTAVSGVTLLVAALT